MPEALPASYVGALHGMRNAFQPMLSAMCCAGCAALTGDGGVIKTILKEGKDWAKPRDADEVCVR